MAETDWQPVSTLPKDDEGWQPVSTLPDFAPQQQPQQPPSFIGEQTAEPAARFKGQFGDLPDISLWNVAPAFGKGFIEGFGSEKLGISDQNMKLIADKIGKPEFEKPFQTIQQVLTNSILAPILLGGEAGVRTMTSAFHGAQQAIFAGTGSRDLTAMLTGEQFFGSPHPMGIPKLASPKLFVKPTPIRPVEGSPAPPEMPRSQLAQTGIPHVDGVINDPNLHQVIDNPVIDRTHEVPNSWGGSTPIENPTTYIDRDFPKELTVDGVTFDPAEPAAIHENVEEFVMQKLIAAGWDRESALRAAYWGWGNPTEHAWYRAHGIDPEHAEAALKPHLDRIASRKANPDAIPPDLFKETYPNGDPLEDVSGTIEKPTPDEIARAQEIIAKHLDEQAAKPVPPNPIEQARDLGVIGPERPEPTFDDSPAVLAERALPRDLSSAQTPEDMRSPTLGHKPGEYDQRGKEWIAKIDEPDHVRDVIENIAMDHDFFPEARGGVASEASRAAVAEAAGIDPAGIDREYFSTHFDSDGKVRAVIQALRQTAKDFNEASKRAVKEPSVENAAAAVEAELRHTHVLEYVMGLRAESGRSLAAWKDLLRETEHSKARVAIKADEQAGKAPVGTADLIDAVKEVKDNLKNPKAEKLGLQKLIDAAHELVGKEAKAPTARQPMAPEIADLIGEARKTLNKFGRNAAEPKPRTELSKLIDRAEKQALDMTKQKVVKEPVEALPPELQALVDKADRVVDRFGGIAKGEKAALLLANTGRTAAEQEQLARSVSGLTPNQVARVLEKLRNSPEAKRPGWFYWLWQQGLISGLITHTGYAVVNTATVFMERVMSPTLAALIGRGLGQRASVGAPLWGSLQLIHSLPDAFTAAAEAFRTGQRVPLASELRLFERGEESPQTKGAIGAYTAQLPDWGIWKRVFNEDQLNAAAMKLGIPGRAANLMHTFFKVLSERAAGSTRAYEAAFAEGARGDRFWDRYQYHLDNPTDDALRGTVTDAYTGAFMNSLTPGLEKFASTMKKNPVLKWMFPFQHIPWNIERMSIEYSPFKVLGPEMRAALLGKKGAPAQNLAIAKMVIGSSIMGYFIHKALAGEATSDYPTDPTERRRWELLRIQPNSIMIGNEWVNLERLGPVGNVVHMGAALGSIIKNYDGKDDDALTSAIWAGSVAAANQIGNEVGFQTLKNIFDAMSNKHKGERFVAWQAGSLMYPSSFLAQNASFVDPYVRQANNFIAGLKYRIPFVRETLPPKLDPLYGEPVPNPAYHAIKRQGPVNADPVKMELDALKYYPGPPANHIGGVKLPPMLYDRYQEVAGAMVKYTLENIIAQPGWHGIPALARAEILRDVVKSTREAADVWMLREYPQIIQQGVENQLNRINGVKPTKLQEP